MKSKYQPSDEYRKWVEEKYPRDKPPFILTEKEFWKCPVHVMTGMSFLILGIIIGVLLMVIFPPRPANAGTVEQMLCMIRADNARLIMTERQDGRDKHRLLRIINKNAGFPQVELDAFKDSIERAYAQPKAQSTFERREIIDDFSKDVYLSCMRHH